MLGLQFLDSNYTLQAGITVSWSGLIVHPRVFAILSESLSFINRAEIKASLK